MLSVWGTLIVVMAGLYIYRASLTRDEEDQIFLDESFDHERVAQAAIVERVAKLEPVLRATQWLVAVVTAVVLVYYVHDVMVHVNLVLHG